MLFDKNRNKATPKARGVCPACNVPLIAKCGRIKIHHWAHENLDHCDHWYEPVTQWHLDWQNWVKPEFQEVYISPHIADIQLPNKHVIEIQHSPISCEEAREREDFYCNMAWIFDASSFERNFKLFEKESQSTGNIYYNFAWKRPRLSIAESTKPIYLDFGEDRIFQVKKFELYEREGNWEGRVYISTRCKGWGYMLTMSEAVAKIFGQYAINADCE